jgi:hypothetical protein
MKSIYSVLGLTAGVAMLLAVGCGKEQPPSTETTKAMNPPATDTQKAAEVQKPAAEPSPAPAAAQQAVSSAASDAQKAVDAQTPAAAPTPPPAPATTDQAVQAAPAQTDATMATTAAAAAPSAASTQVQGLVDKAKGLVTNQQYQEALTVVQQLSSMKLTPEQQTMVDGLKTQIQAALAKTAASDAASSLNNVLGGKK